jgi:hypothetical protein
MLANEKDCFIDSVFEIPKMSLDVDIQELILVCFIHERILAWCVTWIVFNFFFQNNDDLCKFM